jgi:hypothetical protein
MTGAQRLWPVFIQCWTTLSRLQPLSPSRLCILQCCLIEHTLSQQPLELGVCGFKFSQALSIRPFRTALF